MYKSGKRGCEILGQKYGYRSAEGEGEDDGCAMGFFDQDAEDVLVEDGGGELMFGWKGLKILEKRRVDVLLTW